MADFSEINQEINEQIKANGQRAITGAKLNEVLRDMISSVDENKMDVVEIDTVPTEGSTNLVKSGGVYDALQGKVNVISVFGIQNLTEEQVRSLRVGDVVINKRDRTHDVAYYVFTQIERSNSVDLVNVSDNIITICRYAYGVYQETVAIDIAQKASEFTNGNVVSFDENGNLADSGIASSDVATQSDLTGKQDTIDDLATIRSGAALGATALQAETDPTVPSWAKQSTKPSYDYSEIGNTPDLSGFITKSVNDLTNYYLKSETYTKAEVAALIAAIQQFHYEIYATLPQTGQSNVLYLIGPTGSGADRYEEYVYSNSVFTKIGDTSIDLSGYVTTSALNTALAEYTPTSNLASVAISGSYNDLDDKPNFTNNVPVSYNELKLLRDGGNLVPGTWYRITDYVCTTTQEDTQAAQHQFDIIVQAIDGGHLSEEAYAAHHGNDTYFQNNKLDAWELKYCLDNDRSRFGWAADGTGGFYVEYEDKSGTVRLFRTAIIEDKETVWQYGEGKDVFYSAPNPEVGDYIYTDMTLSGGATVISAVGETAGVVGTGVVYYMKDEFGNECPYDFKNIMFKRFEITAVNNTQGVDNPNHFLIGAWGLPTNVITVDPETSEWFYTFSSVNSGTVSDASLAFDYNDINGKGSGASLNVMKAMQKATFRLNNNVFINATGDLKCVGNVFERNCSNNTLENKCNANKFLDFCMNNQFSQNCSGNQFSQNCSGNQFSQNCWYNQFSQNCWYNQFSQDCSENQFSQDCSRNQFSQNCWYNQFSQNCWYNQFSQDCSENQFSQGCSGNQFSQYCSRNQFSQGCSGNQFSQECSYNQFSQYCQSVVLPENSAYFRLQPNVQYCTIEATGASGYPRNVQILSGVIGTSNTQLTITVAKNKDYTQMVGKNTSGTVKVWNPADLAKGVQVV